MVTPVAGSRHSVKRSFQRAFMWAGCAACVSWDRVSGFVSCASSRLFFLNGFTNICFIYCKLKNLHLFFWFEDLWPRPSAVDQICEYLKLVRSFSNSKWGCCNKSVRLRILEMQVESTECERGLQLSRERQNKAEKQIREWESSIWMWSSPCSWMDGEAWWAKSKPLLVNILVVTY